MTVPILSGLERRIDRAAARGDGRELARLLTEYARRIAWAASREGCS